jgi:hypothetical protein
LLDFVERGVVGFEIGFGGGDGGFVGGFGMEDGGGDR